LELTSTAMSEACIDISVQYIYTLCSIPPTPKGVGFLLQFIVTVIMLITMIMI